MNRQEAIENHLRGRHCANCVLGAFEEETGYPQEETDRISACFGGGMYMQQTCGAVTGALMALGIIDGSRDRAGEFEERFKEAYGSCMCADLLDGMSLQEARDSGKMLDVCPDYICGAIDILKEMLDS